MTLMVEHEFHLAQEKYVRIIDLNVALQATIVDIQALLSLSRVEPALIIVTEIQLQVDACISCQQDSFHPQVILVTSISNEIQNFY